MAPMDLKAFRDSRGLSQQAAATELGLKSKSYLSMLEAGVVRATLRAALRIETWSGGTVRAVDLLNPEDAQLLSQVISRASAPPAD